MKQVPLVFVNGTTESVANLEATVPTLNPAAIVMDFEAAISVLESRLHEHQPELFSRRRDSETD